MDGLRVVKLDDILPQLDILITATGVDIVMTAHNIIIIFYIRSI